MLPKPKNYAIWPSVILADTPTEMTIIPTERAFLFFEDQEYTLTFIPVNSDESYYKPFNRTVLTVKATNGVLRFQYTFAGEQEHLILLTQGERKLGEVVVYSLYEDLYKLTPLKGDLHSHSYRSDGRRDPVALAGHYREQGYDFFALTDHNRYYPGQEIVDGYKDVKLGITILPGEEVHTPGSVVHIVHVGGESSVTELYVKDIDGYKETIANEYLEKVPPEIPEGFKERYAAATWATEHIHQVGGLAIFPHPFWRPGASRAFNVCDAYSNILLKSGMFDAYELIGGMKWEGNNRSVALWSDLRANGLKVPVVGSSDVHATEKAEDFPYLYTICFAENNDNTSIVKAVKEMNTVAVESTGYEYNYQYRCHSNSLRLVSYAHFLLHYYFPLRQRICQGEGVAMRAYAMGEASAALIELQVELSKSFSNRFFGKEPPVLPSAEILDFESRWRQRQLEGPLTKGSTVYAPPISRQL